MAPDGGRFQQALEHFTLFFNELNRHFVEREELLQQIALALLSREHVLISGPPGTAKSRVASAVLQRIVDEETGQPSLYARQFTESTVQTDLIGPIDFKTLTETGRTEHFTDEGMLGAVHAFLDEVFDGRDMLLRSTLNVLHERELKQGTKTTTGQIECAVMTTNRYLSEVLEHSRETLLAFVDRIAFVSFVPKGFARDDSLETVLRTQIAGQRPHPLTAPLTIQDLDVLQAAVDSVKIPPALCGCLVALVRDFETELAAAVRADPTFVPTRYLSTRSIVRLGKLLKAICIARAYEDPGRPLAVSFRDIALLRHALVLGGCDSEAAGRLLETETDARERRQIALLRTEREIFNRCLARLKEPDQTQLQAVRHALDAIPPANVAEQSAEELLGRARQLSEIAGSAEPDADRAAELLEEAVLALTQRALADGLTTRLGTSDTPVQIASNLAALADELERTSGDRRAIARWLRGRALDALHRIARLVPTDLGWHLETGPPGLSRQRTEERVDAILARMSTLAALRDRLRAGGAIEADPSAGEAAWRDAVERALDTVVHAWDDTFRMVVEDALRTVPSTELGRMIDAIEEPLEGMDAIDGVMASLHPELGQVKARVVGPRIGALVRAAFGRFRALERLAIAEQVEGVLTTLEAAKLLHTIAPSELLTWTAEALLRSDSDRGEAGGDPSEQGYRNLRLAEQRVSCIYTLVDVCLRLSPSLPKASGEPAGGLAAVRETLRSMPEEVLRATCQHDLDRVERPLALLERWWKGLSADIVGHAHEDAVQHLVQSKFFRITTDEQALARFELELELLRQATGLEMERCNGLSRRITALAADSSSVALGLLRARTDALWETTLGGGTNPS